MSRLVKPAYKIFPQVRVEGYGGGIECFLRVVVLNSTEITGHDCSLYAYVPADIYPEAAEHERVQVLQVPCVRLGGHAGVTLSPGPTELHINRNLILQGEHYNPAEPIPIFFRVYDSCGLALFQRFSFAPQTRVLQLLQDIEVGRRMGGIQP